VAPQEAGFIISRPEVTIAPVLLDETVPFGFISHVQGRRIARDGDITLQLLVHPLAGHMPRAILPGPIRIASKAGSFRYAEECFAPLVPHFPIFIAEEAQALAEASVDNGQIWDAALCKSDYLPEFIKHQAKNIKPKTLRVLKYQIANSEWYKGR
jgi:hypothetical protein